MNNMKFYRSLYNAEQQSRNNIGFYHETNPTADSSIAPVETLSSQMLLSPMVITKHSALQKKRRVFTN